MDDEDDRPIERIVDVERFEYLVSGFRVPIGAGGWADDGNFSSRYLDRYAVATMLSLEHASKA